jgi:hypothetical protein
VQLALFGALFGENAATLRPVLEPRLNTPASAALTHAALAVLLLHEGRDTAASEQLQFARSLFGQKDVAAVRALLALRAGDNAGAQRAILDAGTSLEADKAHWLLVSTLVAVDASGAAAIERLAALAARIPGPLIPFLVACFSRDRTDEVRLDNLFDDTDSLHDINPTRIPLVPVILGWMEKRLAASKQNSERILVGLASAWLGHPRRLPGVEGSLVLGLGAVVGGRPAEAVRHLQRLDQAETAPPAWRGLYARALEDTDAAAADEYWQRSGGDTELEGVREMHEARALAKAGQSADSFARYRTLYLDGSRSPEVLRALSLEPKKGSE